MMRNLLVEIFTKRNILKLEIYVMDMLDIEKFLDQLIHNQRKAIRFYVFFVIGLVVLGIIVIALAFLSPTWLSPGASIVSDVFKGLFGLGGSFVLTLSGFQFNEISKRKEKIQAFETFKGLLGGLKKPSKTERAKIQKQFDDLFLKYFEKAVLS